MGLEETAPTLSQPAAFEPPAARPPAAPAADIAALTRRLARQEEAAYHEFYTRYFHRLLAYLLVVTGGKEEAAREALQATFLRVVRHIKQFDSEATFWSWLTVLARSAAVDEQRKQKRYLGLLDRFFHREQADASPADPDANGQLVTALTAQLVGLPADERDLIERKYFQSQSVLQIAGALDLTEKAVESRLVRVRRKLKELILSDLRRQE